MYGRYRLRLFSVIDRYIIRRFIFTFLFIMSLFVAISIVLDLTERLDIFMKNRIGFFEVIKNYYAGFVPWIAALLGPFFVFLSVIWVASRMTYAFEMVSIIGNGVTFRRLLVPFTMAAAILFAVMWFGNHYLVPAANAKRFRFDNQYVTNWNTQFQHIELTTSKTPAGEVIASMQSYNTAPPQFGLHFSLKTIEHHRVTQFIQANRITWQADSKSWLLNNYEIWDIAGPDETLRRGKQLDTSLGFTPADLVFKVEVKESMSTPELNQFVEKERTRGSERIPYYQVEKHQRTSNAFSVFILTLMGVAVSMRRVRGGRYWPLAFGIAMSAIFFLFMRFSTTFATNAGLHPLLACWLPNVVFGIMALIMLRAAPK
jgi:lipopolysaccharide export system permease protein